MPRPTTAMGCLKCGGPTTVLEARQTDKTPDVRRRRVCKSVECGYRFTTLEIIYGPHPRCAEVAQWASQTNRDTFDVATA